LKLKKLPSGTNANFGERPLKTKERWRYRQSFPLNLQFFANDPSRTEEATPKRKQEARKKGQVPKSTELNSVVVLFFIFVLINTLGGWMLSQLFAYLRHTLSPGQLNQNLTDEKLSWLLLEHGMFFARVFFPVGIGAMAMGILINYFQVGPLFVLEPLKPKFNRINPLNGFKNVFSSRSIVELSKAVGKLLIVCYFAYSTIKERIFGLNQLITQSPLLSVLYIWDITFQVALKICTFLFVLAIFDYAYQRWEYQKSLRMTKKEVKDEFKQMEGDPKIKAKIRQRQMQIAMRRMMQEVPKADVVITNPTHLAIALRYDSSKMAAPVVVAKGEDLIAAKIREVASEHGVTIVENKPLAQAIYKTVDIGEAIPAQLFQAVAEVLAFVYRLKQRRSTAYSR
jgi:flagellar biosynthetic protein FlhB